MKILVAIDQSDILLVTFREQRSLISGFSFMLRRYPLLSFIGDLNVYSLSGKTGLWLIVKQVPMKMLVAIDQSDILLVHDIEGAKVIDLWFFVYVKEIPIVKGD